jgi:hypothetical protein
MEMWSMATHAVRINQRLLLEGSFEWKIECLELPQEQTSAGAALMSQNDPKRTLCPLLSTAATGHWRGLREESRRAIFNSCYRRDYFARTAGNTLSQYPYVCHWRAGPEALTVETTVPITCTPPFPKFSAIERSQSLRIRGSSLRNIA